MEDEGAGRRNRRAEGVAEGVIVALLPSQLVTVDLGGRHQVTAHLGDPVTRNFIRVLVGDRVQVAILPGDRSRGRVVAKL